MFGKKNKNRAAEKAYYEQTRKNQNVTKTNTRNTNIGKKTKTKVDPHWYTPAAFAVSYGLAFAVGIAVQYLAMGYANIKIPVHQRTGFFHSYGVMQYYIPLALVLASIIFWYSKRKFWATWYNNNLHLLSDEIIEERATDGYVRTIDHLARQTKIAPDVGLKYDAHASTLLSHAMISNKGIRKVRIPVYDPNVDGFIKRDEDGNIVYETKPMFDEQLAHKLFDMSNVPKEFRTFYDATDYLYNPIVKEDTGTRVKRIGDMVSVIKNRKGQAVKEKKKPKRETSFNREPYETLADAINESFHESDTETARPAGIYFVDSRPVNTILIAITRGGKGQTYIEPAIDCWTRETDPWNYFGTDPKGELLAKYYYAATVRGFEVIQFNLMNPNLTNVFNPLINALQKFRRGDYSKGVTLIDNLIETLFPDNGDIWNPAAGNMFRRAVYSLFDYYIEQEQYIRYLGYKNNVPPEVVEDSIDKLYSKITLYNVYVLIGELAAKVSKDPKFINIDPDAPPVNQKDFLTLMFDAMAQLPPNELRQYAITADNSIKQIATAPQTIAGIYATLLTGLSIYADPTTVALMSGSISDSFDVGGLAFPRRFGIQLDKDYVKEYRPIGELATWTCYKDPDFKHLYKGSDYEHQERIPENRWIFAYFKGKFPKDEAYLKLQIWKGPVVAQTLYFKFIKGYKTAGGGISYVIDPITKQKIVQGGVLVELEKNERTGKFEPKRSTHITKAVDYHNKRVTDIEVPVISSTQCYYSERAKFIKAVTPPHLQNYQKHILIIIKQIIDEIYADSYVRKNNRKPIVGTRLLLEEFGNIRSGEKGIPNIDTVTSIALGQDLQITFVLQSFQQLRAIYGDEVEKTIRANAANIIFLKSNDEELINDLVRLSGVRHEIRTSGLSVARKPGDIITVAEPVITYNRQEQETTTLTSNDLLFLAGENPGNSITFTIGEMPIVNKLATITPMAAGLHERLPQPKTGPYSDSALPTTNRTGGISLTENVIDGEGLVRARVAQAHIARKVKQEFLAIAEKGKLTINERDGELASAMMNIVYELYDKESGTARVELADTKPYWQIAEELFGYIHTLKSKTQSKDDKLSASKNLREQLVRCAMDDELAELTQKYVSKPADNPIGYDYVAVTTFAREMRERYKKTELVNVSVQNVFEEARKDARYKEYDSGDLLFDIMNSFHRDALEDIVENTIDNVVNIPGFDAEEDPREEDKYIIRINGHRIGWFKRLKGSFASDYSDVKPEKLSKLVVNNKILMNTIQDMLQEG